MCRPVYECYWWNLEVARKRLIKTQILIFVIASQLMLANISHHLASSAAC